MIPTGDIYAPMLEMQSCHVSFMSLKNGDASVTNCSRKFYAIHIAKVQGRGRTSPRLRGITSNTHPYPSIVTPLPVVGDKLPTTGAFAFKISPAGCNSQDSYGAHLGLDIPEDEAALLICPILFSTSPKVVVWSSPKGV